jgi:hypothetical protein
MARLLAYIASKRFGSVPNLLAASNRATLHEASLAQVFLLQKLGEFRWRTGQLNTRDAVLVGGPAITQAARVERLPTPAGAQVVVTEKSWSVH